MFSVVAVTAYLILYVSLISLEIPLIFPLCMLIASPVLIIWMVLSVLQDKYDYPDLTADKEWGYRDI